MTKGLLLILPLCLLTYRLAAQSLDPAQIVKPLSDSWPTYSGDYSGKRYSALTAVNQSNVKNLTLAWTARVSGGPGNAGTVLTFTGGGRPGGGGGGGKN